MVFNRAVSVGAGPHHVVVEARNRVTGSIGTFREVRELSFTDTALAMSDLLLASRIETLNSFPETSEDLKIIPNPLRIYDRSESVFLYTEVYSLTRDAFGRTEYDITYRIGRPEKEEVDPALFAALDLPEARARVEIKTVAPEGETGLEEEEEDVESTVDYQVRYVLPERNRISQEIKRMH